MMFRPVTQAIQSNIVFRLSTILGLFPFRVKGNELKVDRLLMLYSLIVSSCFSIGIFYSSWVSYYDWGTLMTKGGKLFDYILVVCCSIFHSFCFFLLSLCLCFNRNALIESVHSLDELEPFFNKLERMIKKRPIHTRNTLKYVYYSLVCGAVLHFCGNTAGNIFYSIGFTLVLIIITLSSEQFIIFVDTVSDFFESSSRFLMGIEHPATFGSLIRLENLVDNVSRLVSTSNSINKAYSQQLLVLFFICYSSTMTYLYYLYLNVNSSYGWKESCIPGDITVVLFYMFMMGRLTHSAVLANRKSKEFNKLLYQQMLQNHKLMDNGKLMLHISMKKEVVFTACGFFILDYSLLHSMAASATTYLVILIQFGDYGNADQAALDNLTTNQHSRSRANSSSNAF